MRQVDLLTCSMNFRELYTNDKTTLGKAEAIEIGIDHLKYDAYVTPAQRPHVSLELYPLLDGIGIDRVTIVEAEPRQQMGDTQMSGSRRGRAVEGEDWVGGGNSDANPATAGVNIELQRVTGDRHRLGDEYLRLVVSLEADVAIMLLD